MNQEILSVSELTQQIKTRLETQKDLANTIYNGDTACKSCGRRIDPVQSLLNNMCTACQRRKNYSLVKGRMV